MSKISPTTAESARWPHRVVNAEWAHTEALASLRTRILSPSALPPKLRPGMNGHDVADDGDAWGESLSGQ
jgi:hypothetical protein